MDFDRILDVLMYSVPAVVTGFVAFYFFKTHTTNEEKRMKISLLKQKNKDVLPIKLQAYERMTLFLERIDPGKLLLRIAPTSDNKITYTQHLIDTIEQEYNYNIAQQIYISDECWNVIIAAKNATLHLIKSNSENEELLNSSQLREAILKSLVKTSSPSTAALAYIKTEVREML
ncbi:MAG TPA: hypothetical protein VJ970_06375 [Flavobacteriaceae bacterium]|nr:hypothetical protein [Flavobacteriaceae bacterium]